MIIIRPIKMTDYDDLHRIAIESGHGFTSLPVNEEILRKRISHSEESFKTQVNQPGSQGYLFVMEDIETGQVVGTAGIEAAVGLDNAFYHYHLGKVVHSSRELNIHNTVETLALCNDYSGATEICTLFLQESHRKNSNGRFLSRCRFLFIAEHKERFSDCIIAEMRGVSDENGQSPFYSWLEEHFLSIEFTKADYLTGIGNKGFIAELMPKYPVYVNLLSKEAQKVINKVHDNTVPALRLLEAEGFSRRGYVDIFDAGPTVEAERSQIRAIRESNKYQVLIDDNCGEESNQKYIVCNTQVENFRATQVKLILRETANQVVITNKVAQALQVQKDDWVRLLPN
ncbi:arginine N-succinyltransferase [Colwellia sp. 20A7]|uniref:arginine N-succinyltransferase n=1 Tax=Colwellia sp. 20A7 TaxID=2689569 RepID=UPI0013585FCF|nr:arginine N-succinyltransferase [Colwellia sp. 20A7]